MDLQSLNLVDLLRSCIQDRTDEAWKEFLLRLDRIIGSRIAVALKRAMRKHSDASPEISLTEEIRDVKQNVYLKMVDRDCYVLRRFKGTTERSLRAYIVTIVITVVEDHLRRLNSKARSLVEYSLDYAWEGRENLNLVSRNDLKIKTSILVRESLESLQGRSKRGAEERNVLIFRLWLDGFSLSEISLYPGISISKQAIAKIVAKQKDRLRNQLGYVTSLGANGVRT